MNLNLRNIPRLKLFVYNRVIVTNAPNLGHNGVIINSKQIAGFYVTETKYEPRITVPRHAHRHACFCFVLEGGYKERFREKTLECQPSHLIFRPAEELHSDHFGTQSVRCFIVETESKWLAGLHEYARHFNEPQSFQGQPLSWLAMKLRYESQHADDFTSLTIEGLMLEMSAEIARFSYKVFARRPGRWLNQIREMLNENFAQHVSLAELAAVAGVHPVYLATVFRENFHCTVGEYVRRLRVEFASRELSSTDTPLAEIALAAGFAHQSHFARTFKRFTGLTPRQYRSAAR